MAAMPGCWIGTGQQPGQGKRCNRDARGRDVEPLGRIVTAAVTVKPTGPR